MEVTTRFELVDEGFADPCLTTWPRHHIGVNISTPFGAADEARTRYLHLGKVALYQMSYGRILIMLTHYRGPRKDLRSKGLWGKGESLALITAVLLARLLDKPQDFRRGASDRNRTNDTGIFSPLLYRLSYRGAPDDDYYTRNSGFVKRKLQIFLKKIRLFPKKAFERGIL